MQISKKLLLGAAAAIAMTASGAQAHSAAHIQHYVYEQFMFSTYCAPLCTDSDTLGGTGYRR